MRSTAKMMLKVLGLLAISLAVGAGVTGCKKKGGGGEKLPAKAVTEAKNIFKTRCVVCHGNSGKGDGPGAAALKPKPRNYGDKKWQKSVTDAYIEKIIVKGGAAVGKSALMPPNPDLATKTQVVKAIRQIVRGFGK